MSNWSITLSWLKRQLRIHNKNRHRHQHTTTTWVLRTLLPACPQEARKSAFESSSWNPHAVPLSPKGSLESNALTPCPKLCSPHTKTDQIRDRHKRNTGPWQEHKNHSNVTEVMIERLDDKLLRSHHQSNVTQRSPTATRSVRDRETWTPRPLIHRIEGGFAMESIAVRVHSTREPASLPCSATAPPVSHRQKLFTNITIANAKPSHPPTYLPLGTLELLNA